jgi:hypothetical protein
MDSQAKEKVGVEWRWRDGGMEEEKRSHGGHGGFFGMAMDHAVSGGAY